MNRVDYIDTLEGNDYSIFRPIYSERLKKVVIARSEATWQSHEIASLRSQ